MGRVHAITDNGQLLLIYDLSAAPREGVVSKFRQPRLGGLKKDVS